MSRLRRGLGVLISAGAALSAVLLAPASASAASNIAVQWTTQLADPYMLQVVVSDSNGLQLTGMIVHLYAGATDVYDITDMAYTSGAPASQAWTSSAPIPQAALPPGTYTVAVDATDNNETDTGLTAPTPKPFWIGYTPTLTASANPTTLSYGETGTTISGTATGVVAGSPYTTPVPLGGVAVGLFDARTRVTTPVAMTQSDGSYSGHVELPVAGDDYQVVAASGPTWGSGSISPPLTFTWTKDPTRIVSVKVTPEDFNYGGTVPATITGTAEYDNASTGWQPLTDAPVTGGILLSGAQHTVMTDSSGHFTWQYVPSSDTRWSVEVGDGNVLGYGSATGSVHVAVPLRITSFTASLSTFAQLTVTSCVQATVSGFNGPVGPLEIQYSAQPSGPWISLGRVARHSNWTCSASEESYFSGSLPARLAYAYYRAYVPPTADNESAFGKPILRWKYITRINALHVSPGTVHKGGKLTVSGRLQYYYGGWRNFARQQVLIILKPKGSKAWYWMVKVNTNASGYFTSTFTDPVSASWSADYNGNATHFGSGGAVYYVPIS